MNVSQNSIRIEIQSRDMAHDASRIADEAIAEFLQAAEAGEIPNRSDFVRQNFEVRSELLSFFDAYDHMEGNHVASDSQAGSFIAGQQLGRHSLVRPIGSGSFGTVWLGFDSQLKRPVAIKVPKQDRFSSQQQRELFLSEAQNVAQLEHPNIVPIYDVGETESGEIYLVSRFVAGNELATKMKSRRWTFQESAECIAKLANAIHYAHGRNVIHRDVKPSNILIDAATGTPYLTDFGLAHALDGPQSLSGGTPAYMSPEQAAGDPLDHRSDVFSLGVVLFELLHGQRPFSGENASEYMRSIQEDQPLVPIHSELPVPEHLDQICLKALKKPLVERYESSQGFEFDLQTWLASETSRDSKFWSRWSIVVGVLTIFVGAWLLRGSFESVVSNANKSPTEQVAVNSIDREVAELTIAMGGTIDVRFDGEDYELDSVEAIPDGDIKLLWVMFGGGEKIDDDYFKRLAMLDSLHGIDLFNTEFSDEGFAQLARIKSLRCVFAHATQIGDSAAKSLAQLPRLFSVNLRDTDISNEALRQLQGCDTLHHLRVASTCVDDDGMKFVGMMSNLRELNLSSCDITDSGIKHLSQLKDLRVVKLSLTQVTGESLEHLKECRLRHLAIPNSISKSAEENFKASHPNCTIIRD